MIPAGSIELDRRLVNRLLLDELSLLQLAADDGGHRGPVGRRVAVGEVDPSIGRVTRVHCDIEQPALALADDGRDASDRFGQQRAVFDDAQTAGFLRHERTAIGQKIDTPRHLEPEDHRFEFERVQLALHHRRGLRPGEGGLLALGLGGLFANVDHHRADLLLRQGLGHRRHARGEIALLDRLGEAGVVAAQLPHVVDQAGRLGAGQLRPVAARAQFAVQLRDVTRVRLWLRMHEQRRECDDKHDDDDRAEVAHIL